MSERCEACREPTKYALASRKRGKTVYGYYCQNTGCPHWRKRTDPKHHHSFK